MNYPKDLALLLDRLGSHASIVEGSIVLSWVQDNFPFSLPGTTVEWTKVPSAKTITQSFTNSKSVRAVFEILVDYVGAKMDQSVFVFWHNVSFPTLSMPLWVCHDVFQQLIEIQGQELHIASLEGHWYMEFDPFFDECHAAKVA